MLDTREETTITTGAIGESPAQRERPEPFAGTIAEALRLGWSDHLRASQSVLLRLLDERPSSVGERALCRALLGLIALALDDRHGARRLLRGAIAQTSRPPAATAPVELRFLRLARALAINGSILGGEVVRARRAGLAKFLAGDPESAWIIGASGPAAWADAPAGVRRFARFIAAVHERRTALPAQGPLTAAELRILKLMAQGWSASSVARLLGRRPQTVRSHLRNMYDKLDAHSLGEALAKARALGLVHARAPKDDGGLRPLACPG